METTQVCYDSQWLKRLLKAILVLTVWLIPYYRLVSETSWVWELTTLAFFGLLLGTTWVIRYGEKGAQTRFMNGTGLLLGPGIHFLWNLFPPAREIGITLGLGVHIIEDRYPEVLSRDGRHHHLDTRDPHVQARIPSLFSLGIYNTVRAMSTFLFNFKDDGGRFAFYKIGRLISIVALFLGLLANIIYPNATANQASYSANTSVAPSRPLYGSETADKIHVSSALCESGTKPIMPLPERFVPETSSDKTQLYFSVDENDPRKYLFFHEPKPGKKASVIVDQSLCVVIPAGREILFSTKYRPRCEVNMENNVHYITKYENRNFFDKIKMQIFGANPSVDQASWAYVHDRWHEVDAERYSIKAKALPVEKIPGTTKGYGGIVCF